MSDTDTLPHAADDLLPPAPGGRARLGPRVLVLAVLVPLLACLIAAALTMRFFMWPATDRLEKADAIVVLSGDQARLPKARKLLGEGMADTLVLVGTPDSKADLDLCSGAEEPAFQVVCLRPEPDNTRNEARAIGRVTRERGWNRVIVITSSFHVTRAGILFRRCVDADVRMTDSHPWPSLWKSQLGREWRGVLYLLTVSPGC